MSERNNPLIKGYAHIFTIWDLGFMSGIILLEERIEVESIHTLVTNYIEIPPFTSVNILRDRYNRGSGVSPSPLWLFDFRTWAQKSTDQKGFHWL